MSQSGSIMNPAFWRLVLALLLAASAGCASLRPLQVPMTIVADPADPAQRADVLLVMLPGSRDDAGDWRREGFLAAVRQRGLAVDIQMVEAFPAYYYRDLSIIDRLHRDVLLPGKAAGYRQIWVAGISIGGFGALLAALHPIAPGDPETQPVPLTGLLLLAPYLGPEALFDQVRAAGGLRQWAALDAARSDRSSDGGLQGTTRFERRFMRGLAGLGPEPIDAARPRLLLGYGRDDRFASSNAVFGEMLDADQVMTVAGGHDWPAWIALWKQMLDRMTWPRRQHSLP